MDNPETQVTNGTRHRTKTKTNEKNHNKEICKDKQHGSHQKTEGRGVIQVCSNGNRFLFLANNNDLDNIIYEVYCISNKRQ